MIDWLHNFTTLIDISLCLKALLLFSRALRTFNNLSLIKLISKSLTSNPSSRKVGRTLSFLSSGHCEEKSYCSNFLF